VSVEISEPRPEDFAGMVPLCQTGHVAGPIAQAGASLTAESLMAMCQSRGMVALVAREDMQVIGVLICGIAEGGNQVQCLSIAQGQDQHHLERTMIDKLLIKLHSRGIHTVQLPAAVQEEGNLWEAAKWEGRCDLQGEIPIGKSQSCSVV